MQLIHVQGDVLSTPEDMLVVHCISLNARMGAGVAKQIEESYFVRNEIQMTQRYCPGLVVVHRGARRIANLITKLHHADKPTLESLQASLILLRSYLVQNGIESFATVEIGCGLDRLPYHSVLTLLCDVFFNTNIQIFMHHV